jgi:hypothetical protein
MKSEALRTVIKAARYLLVLPLLVAPWIACEDAPTFDNTSKQPRACDADCDCYSGNNYELGTRCKGGLCLCPVPSHYPTPCCQKGAGDLDCNRQCRPIEECDPADIGVAGTASTTASTGGSGVECSTAADCAIKPADRRCGEVECVAGECRLTLKPIQKIESQLRGDCVSDYCDGQGGVITLPDGEDDYNDGKECTFDTCEDLLAQNILLPDGSPCPEIGAGACFDGRCVECVDGVADFCGNGFTCDALHCVPAMCWQSKNGMVDPGLETGIDCGGSCYPCFNPQTCKLASDCMEGICLGGMCALPTHSDGVKNDNETGIDCGCLNCAPCPDDFECEKGENCASLVCWGAKCQAPKCNDGRQNGDETGVDCGGACNVACP